MKKLLPLLGLLCGACGSAEKAAATATGTCTSANATATSALTISNFVIAPSCIKLSRAAGGSATVTVTNQDTVAHELVAKMGTSSVSTSNMPGTGSTGTLVFNAAGTAQVTCSLHSSMAAVSVVVE